MTRFRPGDWVRHGTRCGEVIGSCPAGYTGELCRVWFADSGSETWIMADELAPVVAHLAFRPRIVGGTDLNREMEM